MSDPLTPTRAAERYFAAWQGKTVEDLRPVLAPDVTFHGAMGTADGVEETLAGLTGLAGATTGLTIRKRLADDTDVMTWFELSVEGSDPMPTVNWTHVENGLITAINVTFDPRPMLGAG